MDQRLEGLGGLDILPMQNDLNVVADEVIW